MVIVCCLKSLPPFFNIPVYNVAGSAQGHQILNGVSELATAHPSGLYVVDVLPDTSTDFARDKVSCGEAHPL